MPVSKPGTLPRWSETTGGTQSNITPSPVSGQQDIGFVPGQRPPAQWINWLFNLIYRWLAYLNDLENQALTIVGAWVFSTRPTFNNGVLVNAPSTSNRPGVDATGNGTAPGLKGTAANNASSSGVEGVGTGAAPGVKGTAANNASGAGVHGIGNGSAPGIRGSAGNASGAGLFTCDTAVEAVKVDSSGGTGVGILFAPNTSRAPMNLGALTSDPSTLVDGDFWYNTTADKFRGRANGVTVDFH